ncbi:hypothetical protein P3X46_013355 [Hevea brasiliensis]|uniref:Transmembrane protein n=1 Tax=Hevea brasiliensis TaxID=3981 RepID=A0ABQ9M3F9_HEVBR|nr:uncharacterized protein LOC110650166 [Hevea brasiliensis]KAJ9174749.1 hypothetical protein P3X46_013355 [Hevea brasiliensis]
MTAISRTRSLRSPFLLLLFFSSISLQFISGISGDPSSSKNGTKAGAHASTGSNTRSKILIILLVVVALGLFSFFLFKFWQKKKREEQYARLLKLFEEDDELEVELGLRD